MNKKLIIAGLIGVALFAVFILLLVFSTGEDKNTNKKPIVTDKVTSAPSNIHQQNQTVAISQPILQQNDTQQDKNQENITIIENKTEKQYNQKQKTKSNIIKFTRQQKTDRKKIVCHDNINYLLCINGVCELNGIVCGNLQEVTINSIIYSPKDEKEKTNIY